jgi:hypothetical protein
MPLIKLQFKPGIDREGTSLTNKGGWYECDKIRFRSGTVEKIGGWLADTGTAFSTLRPATGAFFGTASALWNWTTLSGADLLGIGTTQKYYVQNGPNGYLYDITPIRVVSAAGAAAFAATSGSKTIRVTQTNHGAASNDFVTFTSAASLGGAITSAILNAEFQITVLDANTYTIQSAVAANTLDTGNGGTATIATYQLGTGGATSYSVSGWGASYWGGTNTTYVASTLNGDLLAGATSVTLTNAAGFTTAGTVLIGSELITYTGITSNTLTGCTRGASGQRLPRKSFCS